MNVIGWDVNGGWYLCLVRGMHGLREQEESKRRARGEQEESKRRARGDECGFCRIWILTCTHVYEIKYKYRSWGKMRRSIHKVW